MDPARTKLTPRKNLVNLAYQDMAKQAGSLGRLATFLMGLSRTDFAGDDNAGPPFELPYTLDLPDQKADRWQLHRDLLLTTQEIVTKLTEKTRGAALSTLQQIQADALARLKEIDGPGGLASSGF